MHRGYVYKHNRRLVNGDRAWTCKERTRFSPACKGCLTTAEVVVKANPHCHDGCWKDTSDQEFLSSLFTSASNDFAPPSTAIQSLL